MFAFDESQKIELVQQFFLLAKAVLLRPIFNPFECVNSVPDLSESLNQYSNFRGSFLCVFLAAFYLLISVV